MSGTVITIHPTVSCKESVLNLTFLTPNLPNNFSVHHASGLEVDIEVSLDGNQYCADYNCRTSFHFWHPPNVTGLVPTSGPMAGGTVQLKLITAASTIHHAQARLQDALLQLPLSIEPKTLLSQVPHILHAGVMVPRTMQLAITLDGQQWVVQPGVEYTYIQETFVSALDPICGPAIGGTMLTISGVNFGTVSESQVSCSFRRSGEGQTLQIVPASFNFAEQLLCLSPSTNKPGKVGVGVSHYSASMAASLETYNITTSNNSVEFNVYAPFHFNATPNVVGQAGGVPVHITLDPVPMSLMQTFQRVRNETIRCHFGNTPTPAFGYDQGGLLCVAPARVDWGEVVLRLTLNGQQYVESQRPFWFFDVTSFVPSNGPIAGGTQVTLTIGPVLFGSPLVSSILPSCWFEEVEVPGKVQETGQVTCESPMSSPSLLAVNLSISLSGGLDYAIYAGVFHTLPTAAVTSITPPVSKSVGMQPIWVHGTGFLGTPELKCSFKDLSNCGPCPNDCKGTHISSTQVMCMSPSCPDKQVVSLSISLNGQQVGTTDARLSFSGCAPGTSSLSFQEPCIPCAAGQFQPKSDARYCAECIPSEFMPSNGSAACKRCPANTMVFDNCTDERHSQDCTTTGAVSLTNCTCMVDHYAPDQQPGQACTRCSEGANCLGGLALPFPRQGYWPSECTQPGCQRLAHHFLQCTPKEACPGGKEALNGGCADGYQDRVCGKCMPQFYRERKRCFPCPNDHTWIALRWVGIAAGLALLAYWFVFRVGERRQALSSLSIGISYWQVVGLFHGFEFKWPMHVSRTLHWFSFFYLNIELAQPECSVSLSYEDTWLYMCLAPLLVTGMFMCGAGGVYAHLAARGTRDQWQRKRDYITDKWVLCLNIGYVQMASQALEIFDCTRQPDGSWTLDASPAVRCYESWWWERLWLMVLFSLLYVVGIPLFFLWLVCMFQSHAASQTKDADAMVGDVAKDAVETCCSSLVRGFWGSALGTAVGTAVEEGTARKAKERVRFHSLFAKYNTRHSYWEFFVCMRKLGVVLTKIFLTTRPLLAGVTAMIVLLMAFGAQTMRSPYAKSYNNQLETIQLIGSIVILLSGIAFEARHEWPDQTWVDAIGWFDVAVLIAVSLWVFGCTLRAMREGMQGQGGKEDKKDRIKRLEKRVAELEAQNAPSASLRHRGVATFTACENASDGCSQADRRHSAPPAMWHPPCPGPINASLSGNPSMGPQGHGGEHGGIGVYRCNTSGSTSMPKMSADLYPSEQGLGDVVLDDTTRLGAAEPVAANEGIVASPHHSKQRKWPFSRTGTSSRRARIQETVPPAAPSLPPLQDAPQQPRLLMTPQQPRSLVTPISQLYPQQEGQSKVEYSTDTRAEGAQQGQSKPVDIELQQGRI